MILLNTEPEFKFLGISIVSTKDFTISWSESFLFLFNKILLFLIKLYIEIIEKSILEYQNEGFSILEISHRSDSFQEILKGTKSNLKKLMNIPSNYQILFLQGGATFHNTFVASNVAENKSVSNLVTGTWGQKTYDDFIKIKPTKKEDTATINVWTAPSVSGRLYLVTIIPVKIIWVLQNKAPNTTRVSPSLTVAS